MVFKPAPSLYFNASLEKRGGGRARMTRTDEQNELLGQTGPETSMGQQLRRSWHPIAIVGELTDKEPIRAVRVLSENLVLYRDKSGQLGLMQDRCTHNWFPMRY